MSILILDVEFKNTMGSGRNGRFPEVFLRRRAWDVMGANRVFFLHKKSGSQRAAFFVRV